MATDNTEGTEPKKRTRKTAARRSYSAELAALTIKKMLAVELLKVAEEEPDIATVKRFVAKAIQTLTGE